MNDLLLCYCPNCYRRDCYDDMGFDSYLCPECGENMLITNLSRLKVVEDLLNLQKKVLLNDNNIL